MNEAADRLRAILVSTPVTHVQRALLDAALAAERRATVDWMLAIRRDFQTMPHMEFRAKWPDSQELREVLPSYCGCKDCQLWRSGS